MTKRCKDCEQYQQQLSAKENEIKQLKLRLDALEKKNAQNLLQADSGSKNFVRAEDYEEVVSELNYYKRGQMVQMKQSREATMKKLEEDFLRKHPGESLFNKDFDPTKGEDVVDLQRISK